VTAAAASRSQRRQVQEAVDATELLGRLEHAGGAPSECHLPVPPTLDVGGVVPAYLDPRLDCICRPQRARQSGRHAEAGDRERLGQALPEAPRRAGVALVELAGEVLEADLKAWTATWNENPRPFVWRKTADEILESLAGYCYRISDSGH
jgi:hypothetical protein